jgi:P-type Cu2+ transporter
MTVTQDIRCYHCNLQVPSGSPYTLDVEGIAQPFCCTGCRAVAQTILAGGLQAYYRRRELAAEGAIDQSIGGLADKKSDYAFYDTKAFAQQYIHDIELPSASQTNKTNVHEIELLIDGMNCSACVWLIENYLLRFPAVTEAHINYELRRLRLRWRGEFAGSGQLSPLIEAICRLGYRVSVFHPDRQAEQIRSEQRAQLRRLGVAFIGMMQVGMFAIGFYSNDIEGGLEPKWDVLLRWIRFLVTTPVLLYSCQPFFASAWRALKAGTLNMDVPVTLSLLLAYGASALATIRHSGDVYFDTVTMFAFFLLGGRFLETRLRAQSAALGDARHALLPEIAWHRKDDDTLQAVSIADIHGGMPLAVKPYEIIPVDGVVTGNAVYVDEAAFTGEVDAVYKPAGAQVFAGTVNGPARLEYAAAEITQHSRLQQIVDLVAHAHSDKPRAAAIADRLAQHFVLLILLTAITAYATWHFIDASRAFGVTLAVLAASCPCALSLATPAALTAAITALRRRGILVMSAHALETLPHVSRFVFDKTGTLTDGEIQLGTIHSPDKNLHLRIAATLEQAVSHPIAQAFAGIAALPSKQIEMMVGKGIQGYVDGLFYRLGDASFAGTSSSATPSATEDGRSIYLADEHKTLATFQLIDQVRTSAHPAIRALVKNHHVSLLSGDSSVHTAQLAAALGIDDFIAGASPQQKLAQLQMWQQRGERVAMIGDGINDAPVISAADVSIAVANASSITRTQADCVLLSPRLTKVLELEVMARRTRAVIHQNLAWALAYNAVAIPLAFCGLVQPWLAAAGMSLSSLVVMLNAQRLSSYRFSDYVEASAGSN